MPKPAFLVLDTLDDRREVHALLGKLSPTARREFIGWCCAQVTLGKTKIRPRPSVRSDPLTLAARRDDAADARHIMDSYFDFWKLCNTYGLDAVAAAEELERRVKAIK